jgi:hypothetical protein
MLLANKQQENKKNLVNDNEKRARGGNNVSIIITMHNLQPNSSTHRYTCKQSGYEVVDSQH